MLEYMPPSEIPDSRRLVVPSELMGRIINDLEQPEKNGVDRAMIVITVEVEGVHQALSIPQDTFEMMSRVAHPEPLPFVDKATLSKKELRERAVAEQRYEKVLEDRPNNVTYFALGAISAMGYRFDDPESVAGQVAQLVLDAGVQASDSQQDN